MPFKSVSITMQMKAPTRAIGVNQPHGYGREIGYSRRGDMPVGKGCVAGGLQMTGVKGRTQLFERSLYCVPGGRCPILQDRAPAGKLEVSCSRAPVVSVMQAGLIYIVIRARSYYDSCRVRMDDRCWEIFR